MKREAKPQLDETGKRELEVSKMANKTLVRQLTFYAELLAFDKYIRQYSQYNDEMHLLIRLEILKRMGEIDA